MSLRRCTESDRAAILSYIAAEPEINLFIYGDIESVGVDRDPVRAAELYQLSADQGYAPAQCNLAVCYLNGIGVERDDSRAAELLRQSADQAFPRGTSLLGCCYRDGRGVEPDEARAAELFRQAAELKEENDLTI